MDQSNLQNGFSSGCNIDISTVLNSNKNEKKKVARRRWAILAKALKSPTASEPSSPTDEFSVRRISSFMLLTTQLLENYALNISDTFILDQVKKRNWYKYSMMINNIEYYINIGHRNRTFSAEDLMGFNNTGNICIWPSEETLSYYVITHLHVFCGKSIVELGGGMSCLAGLLCAKYGSPKNVTVTDGNKMSAENVQISLYQNDFPCPVSCKVLKWEDFLEENKFDVILCADCLFFDDARKHLINAVWNLLSETGVAFIMAPRRGCTLENFIVQSTQIGFLCKETVNYSHTVWQKHLALLDNCEYDADIHYPVLIELTKPK